MKKQQKQHPQPCPMTGVEGDEEDCEEESDEDSDDELYGHEEG